MTRAYWSQSGPSASTTRTNGESADPTMEPEEPAATRPVHATGAAPDPERSSVHYGQSSSSGDCAPTVRTAPSGIAASSPVSSPATLAIDVGGTGLKASVLDVKGTMLIDRVRIRTPYPCPPSVLVDSLVELTKDVPRYERVSVGFPGMVRAGKVLTAPNLSTVDGPGTKASPRLVAEWHGFDLVGALESSLGKPTRLANDADLQGMDVISGDGLELVITLGTGLGTAVFLEGKLAPHLEIAHQPFRKGETYNQQIGDLARRKVGNNQWSKRVAKALDNLDVLLCFDRLYVGGGNAGRLTVDLGPKATMVDNTAGILGGIKLWEHDVIT